MTDQTEIETDLNCEHLVRARDCPICFATLLRDLDSAAAGIQRLDRLDAESAVKAIRGLEAKAAAAEAAVREWQFNADVWREGYEAAIKQRDDFRADRDRLAGEVERLSREDDANTRELHDICIALPGVAFMDPPDGGSVSIAEQVRRMYAALRSQDAEVARLAAELAAAREDAARVDALQSMLRSVDFDFEQTGESVLMFTLPAGTRVGMNVRMTIDAARRAGEGGK